MKESCDHTWTGAHGEPRRCQREPHDGGSHLDTTPCPTCQPGREQTPTPQEVCDCQPERLPRHAPTLSCPRDAGRAPTLRYCVECGQRECRHVGQRVAAPGRAPSIHLSSSQPVTEP